MANPKQTKLRVGLLMDRFDVPSWQYSMLAQIKNSDYAAIDLVVLNGSHAAKRSLPARLWGNRHALVHMAYSALDRKLFQSSPDAFESKSALELLAGIPTLTVEPHRTGHADWVTDGDVDAIKKYELDVLIRLGFRVLKGPVLSAARAGVWSFHHGDSDVIRGGPAGFWEVVEGHSTTGVVLQQLTPDLDNEVTLYKSYSHTDHLSVHRNRNNYYWKALSFVPRRLRELHALGKGAFFDSLRAVNTPFRFYSHRLYRRPANRETLRLLAKHFLRYAAFKIGRSLFIHQWVLMFDLRDDLSTSCWRFRSIVPPKDRYWADPHVLSKDGQYHIFIEEFSYARRKAHIAVLVMDQDGNYTAPRKVLERPYHLSYPFVFEWEGEYYMLPETASNRTIEVYKSAAFPDTWQLETTLMENITAADATLFPYQGRWWLFANIVENEGSSTWDELFLFYADTPLSRKWIPHPKNPIVSDVRRARPAGRLFEYRGEIYRPSQNNSRGYGYGLKINRVIRLTETEYGEQEVDSIEPNWDPRITGVHTFAHERRLTLIDAKAKRFKLSPHS